MKRLNKGMARVEWTRTAPDDVEHVAAILILREHISGQRIRPSQGDGGIDILVPTGEASEVDVYQVKAFSSNLTAGQKTQIKKSYVALLKTVKEKGLQVRNWYLTLPLDATRENLDGSRRSPRAHPSSVSGEVSVFLDRTCGEVSGCYRLLPARRQGST